MSREELLYLIPYALSFALSCGVFFFAWQKRKSLGAAAFAGYALGQVLWIGGFILEVVSSDLAGKIFWDGFQWMASAILVTAIPVFAVQFTQYKFRNPGAYFLASLAVPSLLVLALVTDFHFHWIYADPRLTAGKPFSELLYSFTPLTYAFALYGYGVVSWGIALLLRRMIRPNNLYRAQIALIVIGFLIPVIGTVFTMLEIRIAPQRDAIPFTAAVGNLVIAWGLFRFRLFEVVPVGRDYVFESMEDPVVILDKQNQVVDVNAAMLALLGQTANAVIGKPAKLIFQDFPIPIKMYAHVSYARTETCFEFKGRNIHYELTVWPLRNPRKEMLGRVYVSHDITALKELEAELRKLNSELEDRVNARNQELAESYELMLEGFARALELRDKETEGHSRRVTEMSLKIAQQLELKEKGLEDIRSGAILHDIGKISIPDEILRKPGKLTAEERRIIEEHPNTAYKLLSPIPFLKKALEIPYCHHEKWDGTGYPQGLKGEEIPLSARIFAVADVWDALSNDRPYNKAWPREKIIDHFKREAGRHFDPLIVQIFLALVEKGGI